MNNTPRIRSNRATCHRSDTATTTATSGSQMNSVTPCSQKGRYQPTTNRNSNKQIDDNHGGSRHDEEDEKDEVQPITQLITPICKKTSFQQRMLIIPSGATVQRLQCFKTKRCRFWLEGRCNRGEACTYAHTDVELRSPPDLTKTKLCTRWKRGICDKDPSECAYAHGIDELRETSHGASNNMTPSTTASGNSLDNLAHLMGDEEDDEQLSTDRSSEDCQQDDDEELSCEGRSTAQPTEAERTPFERPRNGERGYPEQTVGGGKMSAFDSYHCRFADKGMSGGEEGLGDHIGGEESRCDDNSLSRGLTRCSTNDFPLSSSISAISLDISSLDGPMPVQGTRVHESHSPVGELWCPSLEDEGILVQSGNRITAEWKSSSSLGATEGRVSEVGTEGDESLTVRTRSCRYMLTEAYFD